MIPLTPGRGSQPITLEMRGKAKLTNQEVARRFDGAAEEYDLRSNSYTMKRRAEALAEWVCGTSLELGGGTGAVTASLSDRSRAFHSDISERMCSVARRKLKRPSICLDAQQIPFHDESLDTVIASEVIYYLERPERLIEETFRVLRPGGRLLLSATSPLWQWPDRLRGVLRSLGFQGMFFDDGSPKFLSRGWICNRLKGAGFRPRRAQGIILAPFAGLDSLNRRLESSFLAHLGLFSILLAEKPPPPPPDPLPLHLASRDQEIKRNQCPTPVFVTNG